MQGRRQSSGAVDTGGGHRSRERQEQRRGSTAWWPGKEAGELTGGEAPTEGTYHFLGQRECQVLQVVLVAQGPCGEGCEKRGSTRSHTLEEILLKSWDNQYSSQLRGSESVQIWKLTDAFWVPWVAALPDTRANGFSGSEVSPLCF